MSEITTDNPFTTIDFPPIKEKQFFNAFYNLCHMDNIVDEHDMNHSVSVFVNMVKKLIMTRWTYYTYSGRDTYKEYGNYRNGLKDGIWKEIQGDVVIETNYSMGEKK